MKMKLLKIIFIVSTLIMGVYTFQMYRDSSAIKFPQESVHDRSSRPSLDSNKITQKTRPSEKVKEAESVDFSQEQKLTEPTNITIFEKAYSGSVQEIKKYLENNSINEQNSEGQSLLMSAITGDNPEVIYYLLENGADVNLKDKSGQTALVFASSAGNSDLTIALLKRGADANVIFNKKKFTLLMDASFEGNTPVAKALIEHNAQVDAINGEGKTALHYAAREGHREIVKLLLDSGANKKIRDDKNKSPADYARESEFSEIENLLK